MTRLATLDVKAAGTDPFGLTNYNKLKTDLEYLTFAGADLASAATINITNEFHGITGTVTIDNITDLLGAVAGQQVRLWIKGGPLTIRNNGGGAGNIRTKTGADRALAANEIVALAFDGALWRESGPGVPQYRKATSKTVNNTVAETDLLNGEITLAANDLGTSRVLRLFASGDYLFNPGAGGLANPRLKLKLGATTLIDTGPGIGSPAHVNSANRMPWSAKIEIAELGATNAQWITFDFKFGVITGLTALSNGVFFTTGEGTIQIVEVASSSASWGQMLGVNSAAVDGTSAQALVLSVILPTANAAVELVLRNALVVIE